MARASLKKAKLGPKDCCSGEPHGKQKKKLSGITSASPGFDPRSRQAKVWSPHTPSSVQAEGRAPGKTKKLFTIWQDGTFRWILGGREAAFTKWGEREPNDQGGEDCVEALVKKKSSLETEFSFFASRDEFNQA